MLICIQVVVAELDVRIDAHAPTPDKNFVVIGQSHAMIVPKTDVPDRARSTRRIRMAVNELYLVRPLHIQSSLLLDTQLAMIVVAPSKNLPLCSQNSSEKVATGDLDDWDIEINHVRYRRHILQLVRTLSCYFIAFDFFAIFSHCRNTAHYHKSILCLIIHAVEHGVDITGSHVINDTVEHRVSNGLPHGAILVTRLVLLDQLVCQAEL